jgi:hypothetical protein
MSKRWFTGLVLAAALFATEHARADPPATAGVIQPGVGMRYGYQFESNRNRWGLGLGLDLGYTLESAVYVAAGFDYFFGTDDDRIWLFLAQVGYDFGFGEKPWFVIRPKVGVGPAGLLGSDEGTSFATSPGVTLMLLTEGFLLSLDTRADIVFADDTPTALVFALGVGF